MEFLPNGRESLFTEINIFTRGRFEPCPWLRRYEAPPVRTARRSCGTRLLLPLVPSVRAVVCGPAPGAPPTSGLGVLAALPSGPSPTIPPLGSPPTSGPRVLAADPVRTAKPSSGTLWLLPLVPSVEAVAGVHGPGAAPTPVQLRRRSPCWPSSPPPAWKHAVIGSVAVAPPFLVVYALPRDPLRTLRKPYSPASETPQIPFFLAGAAPPHPRDFF